MYRFVLLLFSCLVAFNSYCEISNDTIVKARKLSYNDFVSEYSINDTSAVIIDVFFDKKENALYSEMFFLPITLGLFFVSPQLGVATTAISLPLFVHGAYTLIRYRKKRLLKILETYKSSGYLPKSIRKKAIKRIKLYEEN